MVKCNFYIDFFRLLEFFFLFKGSVCKKERGFRLTAKNTRFSSLLILLLSFASIKRKLLKRRIMKNVASIQIQKDANLQYTSQMVKNPVQIHTN